MISFLPNSYKKNCIHFILSLLTNERGVFKDVWLRYAFCNSWAYLCIHGFYTSLYFIESTVLSVNMKSDPMKSDFWSNFTIQVEGTSIQFPNPGEIWNTNRQFNLKSIKYMWRYCAFSDFAIAIYCGRSKCNNCYHEMDIYTYSTFGKKNEKKHVQDCWGVCWTFVSVRIGLFGRYIIRSTLTNKKRDEQK